MTLLITLPPTHVVLLNAEAKSMEFFRSSFSISTSVSQCLFIIRRSAPRTSHK
jgi:hypothetical protein